MSYLLYKHTSPSGKSYIGITAHYVKRCSAHRRTNGCRAFHSAIKKYGWDAFEHQILAVGLSLEEANQAEANAIIQHNTMFPAGYNLTTGGRLRKQLPLSEEHKRKISLALKGRKLTEERKLKNARKFIVTNPNGESFEVINLHQFCLANGLNSGSMSNVARGALKQYKGWHVDYVG